MRPVNLIPPEDRRGDRAPLRSGPLSYVLVGGLVVVLAAVVALVTTQNDITEREGQIAQLEVDLDTATQEAESLRPYAEFASLQESRRLTITSLAQSRFDWERVLRELALVIPADVTLDELNGSAVGAAQGSASAGTEEDLGPNLTTTGCAADHDAVARFVAALKDIDGVTRVGLDDTRAAKGSEEERDCGDAGSFGLRVAFDNAAGAPAMPGAVAPAPAGELSAAGQREPGTDAEQVEEAREATNLIPGVAK